MRHTDELTATIRACGPEIPDGATCLERLKQRFDTVEDLHRDLENQRHAFRRGLIFGIILGILSVLWIGRSLLSGAVFFSF